MKRLIIGLILIVYLLVPVACAAPLAPPPISPGEMKVSLTVQVAYGILQ